MLGLAGDGANAVVVESEPYKIDGVEFQLAPFESVEYSYRMAIGSSFVYSWRADQELVFNLHSSPDLTPAGQASDYAESFAAGRSRQAQGMYSAPFSGRHGWFWENRTDQSATLVLSVSRFMQAPLKSSLNGQQERQL